MREVEVDLPRIGDSEESAGSVRCIAFQDLPGRAVGTFHAVNPEMRGTVGLGLLALACGAGVDLEVYSYSELVGMFDRWQDASLDLEDDPDESALSEVDWSDLLDTE